MIHRRFYRSPSLETLLARYICLDPISRSRVSPSLSFTISDKLGRYNFTCAKSRVLRNGEINNKFAFENECPGIKRRQEVDTIDLGRIRDVPFSLTHFSFLGLFSLTAHFLPFLTSEFLSAISQTSCTPLELSEIGPKEERPCPSSLSRRGEERRGKKEDAEKLKGWGK